MIKNAINKNINTKNNNETYGNGNNPIGVDSKVGMNSFT